MYLFRLMDCAEVVQFYDVELICCDNRGGVSAGSPCVSRAGNQQQQCRMNHLHIYRCVHIKQERRVELCLGHFKTQRNFFNKCR